MLGSVTPSGPVPLPSLMHRLAAEPGRPRLTWYGDGGERTELSGHVLDNWVTKTVNLLVEEYDAGPGTRVLIDLPAHWRTVVWALATWRVGACVVLPDADGTVPEGCAVAVTHRPGAVLGSFHPADVVAVALPALALRFGPDLPAGVTDAAAAVMTYGDVLTFVPEADPAADALVLDGRTTTHADLMAWADGTADGGTRPAGRRLVEPQDDAPAPVLATALSVYAVDGSLVLCSPGVAAELATDPARRDHLVGTERVTQA